MDKDLKTIQRYWNNISSSVPLEYKDHWVDDNSQPISSEMYKEAAGYVRNFCKKNDGVCTILEIGCRTGRILQELAKYDGIASTGCDLSGEQVKIADLALGEKADIYCADGIEYLSNHELGKDKKYDVIFMHSVTQYFQNTDYLENLLSLLKVALNPCGVIALIDVPVDWHSRRGDISCTHMRLIKEKVKKLLGKLNINIKLRKNMVETIAGVEVTTAAFAGLMVSPDKLQSWADNANLQFTMEYQLFKYKPVSYKKYRPIFAYRNNDH